MKTTLRTCTQIIFVLAIFLGMALPFAEAYTSSQISSDTGGGLCGTDVNGGSGTTVAEPVVDATMYPGTFPTGFFDNPSHYCFQETETWVNFCTKNCNGATYGGDTIHKQKWFVYNSTYVAIQGQELTVAPGGNGSEYNIADNSSYYLTPPTATLTANPTSITSGQSSTLTWSSTNADSCTSSDFSTGSGSPSSGSASVSPSTTKKYTVTCTGVGGTTTATATVSVTASGVTATLTANPTSIVSGNASALTWSSTNTTSCVGTNFSTGGTISGTVSVSPTVTTTYSITCTGVGGSASANTTVTVSGSNSPNTYVYPNSATQPNLTAGSVAPTITTAGSASTFSAPITNSGGVSTGTAFTDLFQSATDANGTGVSDIGTYASAALASLTSNTASLSYTFSASGTYYLRACADKNSAADSGVITESYEGDNCGPWTLVLVNAPGSSSLSALLTATPSTIAYGASSVLSWTSSKATSCAGTGTGFATGGGTVGTQSVTPLSTTFYSLDCTDGLGNHAYSTQTVTVLAPALSITASPSLVAPGSTTNVVWAANGNVSSCTVSGPGLSSRAISGSSPVIINSESTYTFTCTAGSYTPSASVTVKVAPNYKEF